MRVNAATKLRTDEAIRAAAERLFSENGFANTTTRDIAAAAGIAAGTLFNYFRGKETLALALLSEAAVRARAAMTEPAAPADLEGRLFALVAAELRGLEVCRPYLAEVLDLAASPLVEQGLADGAVSFRRGHLEAAGALISAARGGAAPGLIETHLYWTLYVAVLSFWSRDGSPQQEDTLALLDRSMRLFVRMLDDIDAA